MTWQSIIAGVLKPLAEGWGSTLRYKRDKAAKKASLGNLKLWMEDELEEILQAERLNMSHIKRILRAYDKAWKKYDKDGILKG